MKYKSLILSHLFIAFLLGTFFWPVTRPAWEFLDIAVFKFLNQLLENSPFTQIFWGFVNHKKADLVEDAFFLAFFIVAIVKAPPGEKLRRTSQFLFCIIVAGSIIYFFNQILLREHLLLPRASPSLVISPCVRLSQEIPWLPTKDATLGSFPGDHATTLLLFATFYTLYAGKKAGLYAALYTIFRMLPRLILGAHWLSDIAVGSSAIVLFFLSWIFCTPFQAWAVDKIEIFLKLWKKNETQQKTV